jgi:NhaA family Na+:H+ antiporter
MSDARTPSSRLLRGVDRERDHLRGGEARTGAVSVVVYGDFLCPYCRRFRLVIQRLRQALGDRLTYVFRHFPNERIHPGAEFAARAAVAAARQERFWEMYDRLYSAQPPVNEAAVRTMAREIGLDMERFEKDLDSPETRARVAEDLNEGRRNGVTATPTFFLDGLRYDGAWDFHSMLEVLQKPVGERLHRSARVFASLPAAGGLALIFAALLALLLANSPLAPWYHGFVTAPVGVGTPGSVLSLRVGEWLSEGLLAIFFLIVGLEIRREMTAGTLSDPRAAALPAIAAVGGVIAPALIYLLLNPGPTAPGWSVPTATDIAFVLGILALLGDRVPTGLRVFAAALAVVDDILSVLTLAIFYPHDFHAAWLLPAAFSVAALYALNRWRVYASWPYLAGGILLWFMLHSAGVHGALTGIFLAALLPTRPAPTVGPLLAQAATALAALEATETEILASDTPQRRIEQEPVWDWASRNLSAASDRLLSPADRFERALSPWTAYFVLPLFAFSATGIALDVDLSAAGTGTVLAGVVFGLIIGKPLGIALASWLAVTAKLGRMPDDVPLREFIGAAFLCGVGDTVALLMADQAFPAGPYATAAKIGVLVGSLGAAALGTAVIGFGRPSHARTEADG